MPLPLLNAPVALAVGPAGVKESAPLRDARPLPLAGGDSEARALREAEGEREGEALPLPLPNEEGECAPERVAEALEEARWLVEACSEGEGGAVGRALAEPLPEGSEGAVAVGASEVVGGAEDDGGAVTEIVGVSALGVRVPAWVSVPLPEGTTVAEALPKAVREAEGDGEARGEREVEGSRDGDADELGDAPELRLRAGEGVVEGEALPAREGGAEEDAVAATEGAGSLVGEGDPLPVGGAPVAVCGCEGVAAPLTAALGERVAAPPSEGEPVALALALPPLLLALGALLPLPRLPLEEEDPEKEGAAEGVRERCADAESGGDLVGE